jgi:hypothetical protein
MKTQNFLGLALTLGLILFAALGQAQAQNRCFSEDPGAGSTDRQSHYNWAQQQDVDQLRGNLIYKLNLLARCPAMSDDNLSSAFASISVIIFRYTANANCFNQGFINADWSVHKRWAAANGHQQTYTNLQWRTATGIKCLARAGQLDYFADVSVAIANAPFAGGNGGELQPPPPPPPPPANGLQGTWRYNVSCSAPAYHAGSWNGVINFTLGADGKYSGKANGQWVNTNSADIGGGTLQGNEVTFNFVPSGWTSHYIWKGRFVSAGRIEGTATHYNNSCNFVMTR